MTLTYAFIIGIACGTLNYLYFRKQGYKSSGAWFLSCCAFTALTVIVLKLFI
ncbi:MAG: hypothetical protein ACK49D_01250 [Flavobacteriia bacterium]|nr:hypothetical protein [Cryomorphaceae bacterium]